MLNSSNEQKSVKKRRANVNWSQFIKRRMIKKSLEKMMETLNRSTKTTNPTS